MKKKYRNSIEECWAIKQKLAKEANYDVATLMANATKVAQRLGYATEKPKRIKKVAKVTA